MEKKNSLVLLSLLGMTARHHTRCNDLPAPTESDKKRVLKPGHTGDSKGKVRHLCVQPQLHFSLLQTVKAENATLLCGYLMFSYIKDLTDEKLEDGTFCHTVSNRLIFNQVM